MIVSAIMSRNACWGEHANRLHCSAVHQMKNAGQVPSQCRSSIETVLG